MSVGIHDIGGLEKEFGPIDTREHGYQLWEMQTHAILVILAQKGPQLCRMLKFS